jgi:hypothetical protein
LEMRGLNGEKTGSNCYLYPLMEKVIISYPSPSALLTLIDGPKLTRMIASVQQNGNMQPEPDAAQACPKCGSTMVLREAHKGPHAGKKFWGCSKYPECRGLLAAG